MLAAQATAIFGITFLFFTFLLRILDKMTDQSVNGVDKEHAERSIILRAGPARSKHMQNNNSQLGSISSANKNLADEITWIT